MFYLCWYNPLCNSLTTEWDQLFFIKQLMSHSILRPQGVKVLILYIYLVSNFEISLLMLPPLHCIYIYIFLYTEYQLGSYYDAWHSVLSHCAPWNPIIMFGMCSLGKLVTPVWSVPHIADHILRATRHKGRKVIVFGLIEIWLVSYL